MTFKKFLSLLCSFLIMVSSCAFISFLVCTFTFADSHYYETKLNNSSYYHGEITLIKNSLTDIGLASGIPSSVIENSVTKTSLQKDTNYLVVQYLNYITGKSASINNDRIISNIQSNLQNNIESYAKSKNITINSQTQNAINNYINLSSKSYISNLIPVPYFNSIMNYLRHSFYMFKYVYTVVIILLIATLLILFLSNLKSILNAFYYLFYGLISGGLLLTVLSSLVLVSHIPYQFNLESASLRTAIGDILSGYFAILLISGIVIFLFSIISIAIINIISRRQL